MAQQPITRNHDFESQLELAEMMLNLGRIDEAAVELKKAKDLNEIGAHRNAADSIEHEANLRRLASALDRVQEMQGRQNRTGRIWAIAAAIALLGLSGLMFVTWALNRNEMIEMRAESTESFQVVFAERTAEAEVVRLAVGEQTRQAQQITDLYQENSLYRYQATQNSIEIAAAIESAGGLVATQMAFVATQNAPLTEFSTPLPTTAPEENATTDTGTEVEVEPTRGIVNTPSAEELAGSADKLRIDAPFTANMRQGPDFNYPVIDVLRRGELVTVRAKSSDGYWYDILTDDGVAGWVHTSLAKPVSLDWLPSNSNVPLPPPPRATTVPESPEPTETLPNPTPPPAPTLTATPRPATPVPPTDVPPAPTDAPPTDAPATDTPPTDVPPTESATTLPGGFTTATVEPTATTIAVATNTPIPDPTETPVPEVTETPVPDVTETPPLEPTETPEPTSTSEDNGSVGDFLATITPNP